MWNNAYSRWGILRIYPKLYHNNPSEVTDELYALSYGPDARANSYSAYAVNGVNFLVKLHDDRCQTQNSRVVSAGTHQGIEDDYYRYLEEVIELL